MRASRFAGAVVTLTAVTLLVGLFGGVVAGTVGGTSGSPVGSTAGNTSTVGAGPLFTANASPSRQWAFVDLDRTTLIGQSWLQPGHYLLVHDHEREARGEPCMRFYAVGVTAEGPDEEVLSFRCLQREAPKVDTLTLTTHVAMGNTGGCTYGWGWMVDVLTAIQFPGDAVLYLVPDSTTR